MTTPPIGKAPNDGGGDMERAKKYAEWLRRLGDGEHDADMIDRIVKRVEEAEAQIKRFRALTVQEAGKNLVEGLSSHEDCDAMVDTLKSKLLEAEKALEAVWQYIEEDKNTCVTPGYADAITKVEEALSRLRADGEGKGAGK